MEKVLIITGGNKGIGNGILEAYKTNGYRVFSIARSFQITDRNRTENHIQFDLGNSKQVAKVLTGIFNGLNKHHIEKITLINNAATIGQIGRLETTNTSDIELVIGLNLIAPMILTSCFLQSTTGWDCSRHIINISSGAAIKPFFGLSSYCVSKAAIDMMTRSIALEQENSSPEFKIISVYPGIVDTDMQQNIRRSDIARFPEVKTFREYKQSGALSEKREVGENIYHIDHNNQVKNGSILDLDEYRYSSQKMYPVHKTH